jgi:hypothetical protein
MSGIGLLVFIKYTMSQEKLEARAVLLVGIHEGAKIPFRRE